jgi:hypothetical protein
VDAVVPAVLADGKAEMRLLRQSIGERPQENETKTIPCPYYSKSFDSEIEPGADEGHVVPDAPSGRPSKTRRD